MKRIILGYWLIERYIGRHIRVSRFVYLHVPLIGRPLSLALDRMLLICYGIDLMSSSIDVKALSISHPGGILLGGNGIVSAGTVAIRANSVIVGPVDICDNVTIGAMSLVNKSIAEPGVYVGMPARKVAGTASDEWVAHLDV